MKKSFGKFIKELLIEGAKNIGVFILVILSVALCCALVVGGGGVAAYLVGLLMNAVVWIFHDCAEFGLDACLAWGVVLFIPIAITMMLIEALVGFKKWIIERWYLSAGCIKVKTNWPDKFNVGDHVWTSPYNSADFKKPHPDLLVHHDFESRECIVEKIEYDTNTNSSWPGNLYVSPVED